jgi:hypothetical protein
MKRKIAKKSKESLPKIVGDGTPVEILQKALVEIGKHPPVNGMVIAWYSTNKDNEGTLRYLWTHAGGRTEGLVALLSDIAFEDHLSRRAIFGRYQPDVIYPDWKKRARSARRR